MSIAGIVQFYVTIRCFITIENKKSDREKGKKSREKKWHTNTTNSNMVRRRPLVSVGVTWLQNTNSEKEIELDVQCAGQFCLFVLMCFFLSSLLFFSLFPPRAPRVEWCIKSHLQPNIPKQYYLWATAQNEHTHSLFIASID